MVTKILPVALLIAITGFVVWVYADAQKHPQARYLSVHGQRVKFDSTGNLDSAYLDSLGYTSSE